MVSILPLLTNTRSRWSAAIASMTDAGSRSGMITFVSRRRCVASRQDQGSALVLVGPGVERHHLGVGAGGRAPAARLLPVGLLAQQRLTEPVELGDHLLRGRAYRLAGPFVQLLQLPGHLELDMGGNLIPRQGVQLGLRFAYRRPQLPRCGVRFADHLASL